MEDIKNHIIKFLTDYGIQIIGALIILAIGAFVARWAGRVVGNFFEKKQVELPMRTLAVRVIRLLVFGLAVVLALEKFGVPIAPMVAGIGVAGVGIGLAMQGVLGNLVAGLTIIFTKPFRVGEYIELIGHHGQVQNVELFTTTLLHPDMSRVVIPNRKIVGEVLHNYGLIRQVDLSVGVAYGANINEVIAVLREILANNPRVLKDPAPGVGIASLGDSSVSIAIRPWTSLADFGPAGGEINRAILEQFHAKGIEIPYPQREIRVLGGGTPAAKA
jgi:small conductance mechanosensitive channel